MNAYRHTSIVLSDGTEYIAEFDSQSTSPVRNIVKPRQYKDAAGNHVTLEWLVKHEADWAVNQIRHRDAIEEELSLIKTLPLHPTKRVIRRCHCEYQRQKAWGYNLKNWVGGDKSWKEVRDFKYIEALELCAQEFDTVLVRCNGCGDDILREYTENVKS